MRIGLKKRGTFGDKRVGLSGKIAKIEKNDGLNIYFKGQNGSGLLSFSPREIEILAEKMILKETEPSAPESQVKEPGAAKVEEVKPETKEEAKEPEKIEEKQEEVKEEPKEEKPVKNFVKKAKVKKKKTELKKKAEVKKANRKKR
jgi:outer membrane biosynthesis protein TonB